MMEATHMAKILVVDDDTLTRHLLQQSLEQFGHAVQAAANGREALQMAIMDKPDVMVLDIMMPGINGAEVIREMRGQPGYEDVRIIVVTGSPQPEKIPEVAQADVLLRKPLPIEDLLAQIQAFA